MRIRSILWVTMVLVAPAAVRAQYDYEDFLQAVESGQARSTPPSLEMPRLAQLPDGPAPTLATDPQLQPLPAEEPGLIESLPPAAGTAPQVQTAPPQIHYEQLFQNQDIGLSNRVTVVGHGCHSCGSLPYVRECAVMPYRIPNLPAPATLHGYFYASPCVANVWDGYSCEAAAECAKTQRKLTGSHGRSRGLGCAKTPCE